MRNHTRLLLCLAIVASWCGAASVARAAEGAPVIFEMADGRYFNPSSGIIAESPAEVLKQLGMAASTSVAVETATSAPVLPPVPAIQSAIERGRQMIAERIAALKAENPKPEIVTSTNVSVDVTLAVWNARTDEIKLVEAKKNGAKLTTGPEDPGFKITVANSNGVNSQFAVDDGDNVVVAVRYPIFHDVSVSRRKPRYQLEDVVYVPYSKGLHTPETVAWGQATLRANIAAAYDALRAAGIRSRAFPDRLASDVVDPKLVESIAIIEHVGESILGSNGQSAAESVYVVIAGNQGDAYDYSRSTAGARGLVQFIPSTYALMTKRTELGLIKNFDAGMTDPVNAIKAEIAYLDAELANMPAAVKSLRGVNDDLLSEYLAAAYNGGGTRVHKAIALLGDDWAADPTEKKAALQKQYDTLFAEADRLKKKILAEDDPAVWKPMQAKLNASRAERAKVKARQNALVAASLRQETAIYVQKLRVALKLLTPPAPPQA